MYHDVSANVGHSFNECCWLIELREANTANANQQEKRKAAGAAFRCLMQQQGSELTV